jgi:ACS family tartrate transporter-like MFS transporter
MAVSAENTVQLSMAERVRRHVSLRIMPYLFLLYIVAFIDRVNVGFAKLRMKEDLGFSETVFGFGAGIFFIGYFLLEIPGTLIVERWSARKWIARIMLTWGIFAIWMGFVTTEWEFYTVRFLLGLAEAGFFPGIIVYMSHWFRYEDRAKAVAFFMSALPVSQLIGAPLSGLIMEQRFHWNGLAGWQWVFILEGIPAIILGIVTIFYLTDRPHQAKWLPEDERDWLVKELERERQEKKKARPLSVLQAFRQREVVLLLSIYFLAVSAYDGFTFWLPSILKESGVSNLTVTLLSVIPFSLGLISMLLVGWDSDKTGERRMHTALPIFVACAGFVFAIASGHNLALIVASFCVVSIGAHSYLPSFWAMPTAFLTESAAAAAIGLINSVGNLGGFVGPSALGYLKDKTGAHSAGMAILSASLLCAGLLVLAIKSGKKQEDGS